MAWLAAMTESFMIACEEAIYQLLLMGTHIIYRAEICLLGFNMKLDVRHEQLGR